MIVMLIIIIISVTVHIIAFEFSPQNLRSQNTYFPLIVHMRRMTLQKRSAIFPKSHSSSLRQSEFEPGCSNTQPCDIFHCTPKCESQSKAELGSGESEINHRVFVGFSLEEFIASFHGFSIVGFLGVPP